jgi:hypothetical protein
VKKCLMLLMCGALLLGASGLRAAAPDAGTLKPLAVVSLASYDELMKDIAFVGKLADRPELDKALEGLLAVVTQGKGLAGVDKTRPWGIVTAVEGDKPVGYGFIPVKSLKELLSVVEPYAETTETGGGVYKITPKGPGQSVFVKEQGGWAFAADKAEILGRVVADPTTLLGGLETQYQVAARVFAANLPADIREKALAKGKHDLERELQQRPGESAEEHAIRSKVARHVFDALMNVFNDLDQVTLGWTLDRRSEKTYLDVSLTARPGSPTAQQLATMEATTSRFAGFRMSAAAFSGGWRGKLPEAKKELLSFIVEAIRTGALQDIEKKNKPAEETRTAKELVGTVTDVMQKTIRSGRCDGGMSFLLDPHSATFLAGGYAADAGQLEKVLQTVADFAKRIHPPAADWIKLDAGKVGDVRLHSVSIPIPPDVNDRDKAVQLFGERIDVVVGIGPESVCVAAGRDAAKVLGRAIEASVAEAAKIVPPAQFSVALEPFFRVGAEMAPPSDRPKAKLMADELKKQPGQDHVTLVARPISNGVQYRLEVESGIIRAIGHFAVMASQSAW